MRLKGKNGALESFRAFLDDRSNMRTCMMIVVGCAALIMVSVIRGYLSGEKYIKTGEGNVIGVYRKDKDETVEFPLKVKGKKGDEEYELDVSLVIQGKEVKIKQNSGGEAGLARSFESDINEILDELSESKGNRVLLPLKTESGSILIWNKGKSGGDYILILVAPVLIWALYMSGEKKKKDAIKEREHEIERELPSFCDKLIIMIDSGLITSDAFRRIAWNYEQRKERGFFESRIVDMAREIQEGSSDLVSVLTRGAEEMGSRPFSRIVRLIRDAELKGVGLTRGLSDESKVLWETRKRIAEERGKVADTRMALPLGILLLALIMITVAPAVIQVKGG